MPTVYHGTSRAFATAMAGTPAVGTIDVLIGGGEFGGGFYTQGSSSNAARRGSSIYGNNGAVLALRIDDMAYNALRFKRLNLNAAQKLNAKLAGNQRNTYRTSHDVMVGPLVYQPRIQQQKYQTLAAELLLNGQQTIRTVI